MPDDRENRKSDDRFSQESLRATLQELKDRVASLHQRVDVLEQKKRDESTPGRK